jgi:hypothetical protein
MNFDAIINGLLNLDPSVYALLLGGAAGVSLLTQGAKKLFDLTNEKHIVAIFNIIAIAASGLDYLLTASNLPPVIIGINTLLLTSIAHPIYIFAIKPLSIFISNVQAYKNRVMEKVEQIDDTAQVQPPVTVNTTTTISNLPETTTSVNTTIPTEIISEPQVPTADF